MRGAVLLLKSFARYLGCRWQNGIPAFIFSWFSGLLTGILLAYIDLPYFSSLVPVAVVQPVSTVGYFVCVFLPLIISALLAAAAKPGLLLVVCFLKAAAFGFSTVLLCSVFHAAGWLAVFLFLFSDVVFLPFLFYFWLRCRCSNGLSGSCLYLCAVSGLIICGVHHIMITPILHIVF